ncbi:MAG: isocitrate lyase/phosphoenolpyruvate mutase family protein, partial [Thermoprotei archaeon]
MSQSESKPAELARLLATEDIVVAPGVFNPISAMVAARVGFKALYFSGGGFANSLGLPDLGLTTLTEVAGAVGGITRVVGAPLIVDIDTGFGEALNVGRTVRELELAGAAGVHIEDQVMPKKCGHLPNKEVVGVEDMVKKILAAVESRRNGLLVVARTDARAVEGFDEAVERARVYVRAGADMIFPEALESEEEFKEFARKVEAP